MVVITFSLLSVFSKEVQSIEKAPSLSEAFLWVDFTGREGLSLAEVLKQEAVLLENMMNFLILIFFNSAFNEVKQSLDPVFT